MKISQMLLTKTIVFANLKSIMKLLKNSKIFLVTFSAFLFNFLVQVNQAFAASTPNVTVKVDESALGIKIPSLGDILTFLIRFFFVIAGLAALLFLLLGALAWVTSGGNKESVEKAREKIQAAIIGVILIVVVLSIIWTLEQVVFAQAICFGISCPLTLPTLVEKR